MNVKFIFLCFVGYLNLVQVTSHEDSIKKLLRLLIEARRDIRPSNNLPDTDRFLPGHTLIRPKNAMLKSAVKFPHDDKKLVYGNSDNLSIMYDQAPLKVLNTGFRKGNNILATILKSAKTRGLHINMDNPSVIVIQKKKSKSGSKGNELTDKILTVKDVVKSIKSPAKLGKERSNTMISEKHKQKIFVRPGQVHLSLKTKKDKKEKLDERTKRIQDILNGKETVGKRKFPTEDNSKERTQDVKKFLNSLVTSKEKLSLDNKTKHIEDFLNNKIKFYGGLKSLNDNYANFQPTAQNLIDENENNANEVMDQYSSEESIENDGLFNTRRAKKKKKKKSKHRERDSKYESSDTDPSDLSASSDYERNPGNPFTIHRNKYKQNWLWNHFMDGDHMNLNPFGPPFANMGPSGADLFFGRKWWYYNQDDYKPMG